MQNSSMMKKTLKCIRWSLPEMARWALVSGGLAERGGGSPPLIWGGRWVGVWGSLSHTQGSPLNDLALSPTPPLHPAGTSHLGSDPSPPRHPPPHPHDSRGRPFPVRPRLMEVAFPL